MNEVTVEASVVRPSPGSTDSAGPGGWAKALSAAERACCCSAKPVVAVGIPVTDRVGASVELLLCGHHFRRSRGVLDSMGAVVFDRTGSLVGTSATASRWIAV